jgi:nitroimidazol reductase NimA-like FMN-containing flavoprotein (pyridoxamine 5'-phosphate oxidase superfamily)
MGKVIVPQANQRERAAFESVDIKLIESITEEEFLRVIIDFLNRHNVLFLATCKDNEPRCTPLEYFNHGLTVYVFSEGGGKIANLKANASVAYGIADPYHPDQDFFGASGLQVWGTATVFKKSDDLEKFNEVRKYARYTEALKKQGMEEAANTVNFNVITIEPAKIRYLNYRSGFRNVIWKRHG